MPSPLCPVGGTSLGSERGVGGGGSCLHSRPTLQTWPRGARPAKRVLQGCLGGGRGAQRRTLIRALDSRASPHLADLGAEVPGGRGSPGEAALLSPAVRSSGSGCAWGHSPPATVQGPVLRPPRGGDAVGSDCVHAGRTAGRRQRADMAGWSGSAARSWPPGSSAAV